MHSKPLSSILRICYHIDCSVTLEFVDTVILEALNVIVEIDWLSKNEVSVIVMVMIRWYNTVGFWRHEIFRVHGKRTLREPQTRMNANVDELKDNSGVKGMYLSSSGREAFDQENVMDERLHGLDQQMERKEWEFISCGRMYSVQTGAIDLHMTFAKCTGGLNEEGYCYQCLAMFNFCKGRRSSDAKGVTWKERGSFGRQWKVSPRRNYQEESFTHKEDMAPMAFSDSEVKTCSKTCLKNYEALKKQYDDLLVKLKHEVLFSEEITLLKRSVGSKEYQMGLLRAELEKVKQEKEGFEFKIAKFNKSAKDLEQLLGSQITDKSKKGFGYNVVPSPHPLILNRPTTLDLSYSGLEEFKEPDVNEYGPRDSSLKSTTGCDKKSENSKENTDDSEQHQMTDSETSSFESLTVVYYT
ncbi:hypothetical protein Tco_1067373 [Tanacetum coccineum]|uniref:Uncharacterized protein n=1 Tax=Tanacetum coccineum TaxID=301880 RepID=A0ABQ5HCN4_9ASTR